ncbi:hypothetical protein BTA51_01040 [Hahella sp. CCB-MM4]|nr:hypothetical protein BTA51_01040 [Hahella sp. CCB-MM4]
MLIGLSAVADDVSEPTILLHYNERPPYLHETSSGVEGLTASPAEEAFRAAGIKFSWVNTPAMRQLYIIKRNLGRDCLVGWFKTPYRTTFGKYTVPIYQDGSYIVLMNTEKSVYAGGSLADLLSNRNLVLLVKDSYSYGDFLDRYIDRYKPTINPTIYESANMLRVIARGNADYMFVAPEEAEAAMIMYGLTSKELLSISFPEMPQGEKRYKFCSRQVDDAVIDQLNAAITYRK